MKQSLQTFVDGVGREKFDRALAAATLFVRGDRRFIGLQKVREPIAEAAAVNALGGNIIPDFLKKKNVAGTEADVEFRDFLAAATEHVKVAISSAEETKS